MADVEDGEIDDLCTTGTVASVYSEGISPRRLTNLFPVYQWYQSSFKDGDLALAMMLPTAAVESTTGSDSAVITVLEEALGDTSSYLTPPRLVETPSLDDHSVGSAQPAHGVPHLSGWHHVDPAREGAGLYPPPRLDYRPISSMSSRSCTSTVISVSTRSSDSDSYRLDFDDLATRDTADRSDASPTFRRRLSSVEAHALPHVCFSAPDMQNCSICLENFSDGMLVTKITCGHAFHIDCLAKWVQRSAECPNCRAEIDLYEEV